jgi:hypothetical protein
MYFNEYRALLHIALHKLPTSPTLHCKLTLLPADTRLYFRANEHVAPLGPRLLAMKRQQMYTMNLVSR